MQIKPSDTSLSFEINSNIEKVKEVPSFDNLVAYYPLSIETRDVNTISDMSPNSNHGTNNGATFAEGVDGNMNTGMKFDGNDYIELGNRNFDYDEFTVSLWSKCITNISTQPGFPIHITNLIGKGDWNSVNDWYLGYKSSGSLPATHLSFVYGIGWGSGPSYSVNSFDLSQWNHIVGVATKTSQILYLNGVSVDIKNTSHGSVVNEYNLQISRSSYVSRYFNGFINDTRIYNRALSEKEVNLLYNNSK